MTIKNYEVERLNKINSENNKFQKPKRSKDGKICYIPQVKMGFKTFNSK